MSLSPFLPEGAIMSFTYDLTLSSNLHKVRNLISDTVESTYLLADEEINSLLTINSNDLFITAAICLRRIAASKALVAKLIKAGDYSEDARDVVKNLLSVAKTYEEMSQNSPYEMDSQEILTDFNWRQIIENKILRGEELDI